MAVKVAVEGIAIPGGQTDLGVALVFLRVQPLAADLIGLAELIPAAAALHAPVLVEHTRASLHAIFGFGEIFLSNT